MGKDTFEIALVVRMKHGRLYQLLKDKGWSQSDLANHLGVASVTVSNWMRLLMYPKDPKVLAELERLTGTLAEDLFPNALRSPKWRKKVGELPKEFTVMQTVDLQHLLEADEQLALPSTEEEFAREEIVKQVNQALETLSERDQIVLLGGARGESLEETGSSLGVSREQVRQIHRRALRRIRKRLVRTEREVRAQAFRTFAHLSEK